VKVFDFESSKIVGSFSDIHKGPIRIVKQILDTNRILTGSLDKTAVLLDYNTSQLLTTFHHPSPIKDIAIHPSGFNFAIVGGPEMTIYDIRKSSKPLFEVKRCHFEGVTQVQYMSTGDRVITTG